MNDLNETERQELERLRKAVEVRSLNRTLAMAMNFAAFAWGHLIPRHFKDSASLWECLPEPTKNDFIDFVTNYKAGPKIISPEQQTTKTENK